MSKRSSKSSSSNGFNSEMFPDLHLKMSKKIAQLTKVIYHLNTRNEDFSIDLKAEKQSHANEVEEILQDAADKINKFKSQLAKAKQNSATANATDITYGTYITACHRLIGYDEILLKRLLSKTYVDAVKNGVGSKYLLKQLKRASRNLYNELVHHGSL